MAYADFESFLSIVNMQTENGIPYSFLPQMTHLISNEKLSIALIRIRHKHLFTRFTLTNFCFFLHSFVVILRLLCVFSICKKFPWFLIVDGVSSNMCIYKLHLRILFLLNSFLFINVLWRLHYIRQTGMFSSNYLDSLV